MVVHAQRAQRKLATKVRAAAEPGAQVPRRGDHNSECVELEGVCASIDVHRFVTISAARVGHHHVMPLVQGGRVAGAANQSHVWAHAELVVAALQDKRKNSYIRTRLYV